MFSSEENVLLDRVDYAFDDHQILRQVSLRIRRGEGVCLVGANGSGKSTLGRLISGTASPTSGRVFVRGQAGVVSQTPENQIVTDEVVEEVAFGPAGSGCEPREVIRRVQRELLRLELQSLAGADPRSLSGGEQQRVMIGSMLACQAPVIVLDEPTAYLDHESRRKVRNIARSLVAEGYTVIWITQILEELTMFPRAIVLDGGCLAWDGQAEDLESSPELMLRFGLTPSKRGQFISRLASRGVAIGWGDGC